MRAEITIEREFRFEASHQLVGHDGKCARLHGHSWRGIVRLRAARTIDAGPKAGMVADFGDVADCLRPIVDAYLDHRHLNASLGTDRPTSEFVAEWVFKRVALTCFADLLDSVTIEETCTSRATYREEPGPRLPSPVSEA